MMTHVIGVIDEIEEPGENIDFLLSLDNSGSMGMVRQVIKRTICQWSIEQRWENSRFSIVSFRNNKPEILITWKL